MARPTGARPTSQNRPKRVNVPAAASSGGPVAASSIAAPKKPFNPARFYREVIAEARKISWTDRKETWITSVMVLIMVAAMSALFFFADLVMSWGVNMILKIAS